MKLLSANFKGLPSTENLYLSFTDVNVFVGPNGSGKSTILNLSKFALDILSRNTLSGRIESIDDWLTFTEAELTLSVNSESKSIISPKILENCDDYLHIKLRCIDGKFYVDQLSSSDRAEKIISTAIFLPPPLIEEVAAANERLKSKQANIVELQSRISNDQGNSTLRQQLSKAQQSSKELANEFEELTRCELVKNGDSYEYISREEIDEILSSLSFPSVVFVESEKAIEQIVPKLITSMCDLQSGKRLQKKEFHEAHARLEHLLQHEVDFYEKGGKRFLSIDGADYRKSSSGTQSSLAYFGLTNFLRPNDIVIWDEPENGLHPTRRIRILDLILRDHRQFFIATHALEFAPIFAAKGKIFRCDSEYEEGADYPTLRVSEVKGRKEEFLLLEALGVQPARTLFTANVVFWVEGPTELVFYRHWLKQALQPEGLEEGFHYTIMHYGGGLISYLGVADNLQIGHAFDALSICRKLIIAVDSDLRAEVLGNIDEHLKPGARRVKSHISELNDARPNSGLFSVTGGREIENYLPPKVLLHAMSECWDEYAKHKDALDVSALSFDRYQSFEQSLEEFLLSAGIVRKTTRDGVEHEVVRGKTQWGGVNKVEMMRSALSYPGLRATDLRWNFAEELEKIADFIRRANPS